MGRNPLETWQTWWKREVLPAYKSGEVYRRIKKRFEPKGEYDQFCVKDMVKQIRFRAEMNLTPDNRAIIGLCKIILDKL